MMEVYEFIFDVEPVAKGRPRIGKWGAFTPAKTRKAEAELKRLARHLMNANGLSVLTCPLTVEMAFIVSKPKKPSKEYPSRSDLDNYGKLLCDALNEVVWEDDSQIIDLFLSKRYGDKGQMILKVIPLESNQL